MTCEGQACSVVAIYWDSEVSAYRVKNSSERTVLIVLTSSSGTVSVEVGPQGDAVVPIAQFDLPYQASYLA